MSDKTRNHHNIRRLVWTASILFAMMLTGTAPTPVHAEDWRPVLLPASINQDRTVHMVGGHIQPVFLMFQASDAVRQQAEEHKVEVYVSLPIEVKLLDHAGQFHEYDQPSHEQQGERVVHRLPLRVSNHLLAGHPGANFISEWTSQALYLDIPEQLPAEQRFIEIELRVDGTAVQQRWPMVLHAFDQPGIQNRLTRIGMWSYGYTRAGEASGPGLAAFLQQAGIGHTQLASEAMHSALVERNIINGGDVHHDHFFSSQYPDVTATGAVFAGGFACPVSAVEHYHPADLPGVSVMAEAARRFDGIATVDYEPEARFGFSDHSIERFKQDMDVSDEAFDRLRAYIAEHGLRTYITEDSEIAELYKRWVDWRTKQVARYVRHMAEGFKELKPDGRFELTPNPGYDDTGLATLGYGYNAVEMARYVDAIQPQIYVGYGGAGAKLAMQYVRNWRQNMKEQNAEAELHPILLVRYAGASVFNNPNRLHQQIIGAIAEGADGILLYYPDQMDAPYWIKLSKTTRTLDRVEQFYHEGERVDEEFPPQNMLEGTASVSRWPAHKLVVENPEWHMTAHRLNDRVLLTLFNLHEANDVIFSVQTPDNWHVTETMEADETGDDWLVAPQSIGFVVLEYQ
ncbi:family 10 glycosylhydrolase [Phycisphaerales bacterium AB-hyl4]|uniref:Family 10 glycosylhydrolase n=1 Tax=Natronomicrosphaera hydrolytica TaxID=3242702 RepID=A0ABV4U6W0_9BACT